MEPDGERLSSVPLETGEQQLSPGQPEQLDPESWQEQARAKFLASVLGDELLEAWSDEAGQIETTLALRNVLEEEAIKKTDKTDEEVKELGTSLLKLLCGEPTDPHQFADEDGRSASTVLHTAASMLNELPDRTKVRTVRALLQPEQPSPDINPVSLNRRGHREIPTTNIGDAWGKDTSLKNQREFSSLIGTPQSPEEPWQSPPEDKPNTLDVNSSEQAPKDPLDTAWTEKARCRGVETEIFFDDNRKRHALAFCGGCKVRAACLNYALEKGEEHGVWGGLTAKQRRKLLKDSLYVDEAMEDLVDDSNIWLVPDIEQEEGVGVQEPYTSPADAGPEPYWLTEVLNAEKATKQIPAEEALHTSNEALALAERKSAASDQDITQTEIAPLELDEVTHYLDEVQIAKVKEIIRGRDLRGRKAHVYDKIAALALAERRGISIEKAAETVGRRVDTINPETLATTLRRLKEIGLWPDLLKAADPVWSKRLGDYAQEQRKPIDIVEALTRKIHLVLPKDSEGVLWLPSADVTTMSAQPEIDRRTSPRYGKETKLKDEIDELGITWYEALNVIKEKAGLGPQEIPRRQYVTDEDPQMVADRNLRRILRKYAHTQTPTSQPAPPGAKTPKQFAKKWHVRQDTIDESIDALGVTLIRRRTIGGKRLFVITEEQQNLILAENPNLKIEKAPEGIISTAAASRRLGHKKPKIEEAIRQLGIRTDPWKFGSRTGQGFDESLLPTLKYYLGNR